jgi:hypothetical protein
MTTKEYRASATGGFVAYASTPRAAAEKFFTAFPKKRKCNIIEGTSDGTFFTVTFGRASEGKWPQSWKDISQKTVQTLPEA